MRLCFESFDFISQSVVRDRSRLVCSEFYSNWAFHKLRRQTI